MSVKFDFYSFLRKSSEIDALQSLQDGLEEKLKIEIEKINDEFNISKYTIEEFFIKPKRTDIYDIKIELLWQEQ